MPESSSDICCSDKMGANNILRWQKLYTPMSQKTYDSRIVPSLVKQQLIVPQKAAREKPENKSS